MKIKALDAKGLKIEAILLPSKISFAGSLNLIAQAVHVALARAHPLRGMTKTRAEVKRTKKKLYRQKGTGGARHGARSAPIFVGGGVAHGPRGVKRKLVLPKKMARKALFQSIALKVNKDDAIALKGLSKFKKTKEVSYFLKKTGLEDKQILFVLKNNVKSFAKVVANIKTLKVVSYPNLNTFDVIRSGKVIFDSEIFAKGGNKK